jgi:hypothetical protein
MSTEDCTDLITALRFSGKPMPQKYIDKVANAMSSAMNDIVEEERIAKADLVIFTLFITYFF